MKSVGFHILVALVRAFSYLPFRVLYSISDLLFYLLWYLIPYRKATVMDNLRHAFPEKTSSEIKDLARKFYVHFCDVMVESIKLMTVSREEMASRIRFADEEMLCRMHAQGIQVMMLMGHYGNWEWLSTLAGRSIPYHFMTVYKTLENKLFNDLMVRLRTRFGTEAVPMQHTFRNVDKKIKQKQYSMMCFIADQNPDGTSLRYWLPFFNREVPVLTGPEKIARKHNLAVGFMHVEKIRRGYYLTHVKILTLHAAEMPEHALTELFTQTLESKIKERPEYWLWTHRRWKHKKSVTS